MAIRSKYRGVFRFVFMLLFALGFVFAFLQTLSDDENRAMLFRSIASAEGNGTGSGSPLQFLSRLSAAFGTANTTVSDDEDDEVMMEMFTGEEAAAPARRIKHLGRLHPKHYSVDDTFWRQAFYAAYLLKPDTSGTNTSFIQLLQSISQPPRYRPVSASYSFDDLDASHPRQVTRELYDSVWGNFTAQRRRNHYETINVVLPYRQGAAEERFVRLCSSYGLFCNTLIVIVKAYAFAGMLNRTLVLPKRFFLIWDKQELDKGPVRVISTEEYISRKIPSVDEACMHNTDTYCCRFMRDALWTDVQYTTLVLHARTLFHGLDTFYLTMFSERYFLCMFHYLKPVPVIQRDVEQTLALLPPKFLAVHLRNKWTAMDRSECLKQLVPWSYWYNVLMRQPWNLTGDECIMEPRYVDCYRNDSATPFFLGTDNVNRSATARLVAIGALRHKPSAALQAYGELLERLERGMGPFPYLVADIMLMAKGVEFIGNPISSFSGVICGLRMAKGLRCVNSPPVMYPSQCVGYPDTRNMFLFWSHLFSQRKTKVSVIRWNLTTCARGRVYDEYARIEALALSKKYAFMRMGQGSPSAAASG